MSPKRNYNKMYNEEVKEPAVETTEVEEVKAVEAEEIKPAKQKFPIEGKVIGGSLNVRIKPDGNVKEVIPNDQKVKIVEDTGDWYKIAGPTDGYVMKKFIEV